MRGLNNAGADILTGAGAAMSDVQKMDLLMSVDLLIGRSWRHGRPPAFLRRNRTAA